MSTNIFEVMIMEKDKLQIVNERSISQMVAETLKKAIFQGKLKLGERLVEANIAKMLKVSITPVRQAFSQLANDGLIVVVPYKGTTVVEITEAFIEEVYKIRKVLEVLAVELSLPLMTEEDCSILEQYAKDMDALTEAGSFEEVAVIDIRFHRLFYERSGNAILLEIWSTLQSRIQLFQTYGRLYSQSVKKGEVEMRHLRIVNAIRNKDLNGLILLVKEHIEAGKQLVINHYKE
jgi:DNA-binding GntR family transcriptional regulator